MNRIDRLTAILIHLQSKKIVTAHEIADRFEISVRTVYRDIRALEEAGVPIGSEAGKGYFIVDGYYLPPVMFTQEEASSLILAEKLVEKMTDISIDNNYKSALYKIKSILDSDEKEYVDNVNDNVHVLFQPYIETSFPNNFISDIQKALANQKILEVKYHSIGKDETTCRSIESLGLCYYSFSWHLIGFCKLRSDYRDFRVDRIKELNITQESCSKDKKITINEYFEQLMDSNTLKPIIVRFDNSLKKDISKAKYYYGFICEKELPDCLEITFLIDSLDYIAKWLLTFGSKIQIISPTVLIDSIKRMINDLNEHY